MVKSFNHHSSFLYTNEVDFWCHELNLNLNIIIYAIQTDWKWDDQNEVSLIMVDQYINTI